MNDLTNDHTNFILYTTPKGDVRLDILVQAETIWLTQKTMSELFGVTVPTINEHLKVANYKKIQLLGNS